MSTADVVGPGPVPVSLPLRERLVAVFRFNKWFPKRSSRRCEKKRSSRTKTESSGAQKMSGSSNEPTTTRRKSRTGQCSLKKVKTDVHSHHQQPQSQQRITSISNPHLVARSKVAKYEPPKSYTSRRIGSLPAASSRNYSGPLSSAAVSSNYSLAASRHHSGIQSVPVSGVLSKGGGVGGHNSGIQSVPVSGVLSKGGGVGGHNSGIQNVPVSGEQLSKGGGVGGPRIIRSSSKSLSKLRDHYVKAMLKLGDMADSVSMGTSVNIDSQIFESEVIRKRSQAENEVMDYYLHSSIQPDEWKNAHMGSRIVRNSIIRA